MTIVPKWLFCFSLLGFTLVICPLIDLMGGQLVVLKQLGISATMLNASRSKVCFCGLFLS
jgi:superfamily II DNA helicase RecQ